MVYRKIIILCRQSISTCNDLWIVSCDIPSHENFLLLSVHIKFMTEKHCRIQIIVRRTANFCSSLQFLKLSYIPIRKLQVGKAFSKEQFLNGVVLSFTRDFPHFFSLTKANGSRILIQAESQINTAWMKPVSAGFGCRHKGVLETYIWSSPEDYTNEVWVNPLCC